MSQDYNLVLSLPPKKKYFVDTSKKLLKKIKIISHEN